MVEQAIQERIPFRAMVADSFHGEDRGLKLGLRKLKVPYVMALNRLMRGGILKRWRGRCRTWHTRLAPSRAEQPGKWVRIIRTFHDGSTQDWWAVEIVAGPYGPDKKERAIVATTDPKTLPDLSTWYLVSTLPAPTPCLESEPPLPPASLEEVIRLYGLCIWVEQSDKHVKHALGWSQYQVRSDRAIRRHWQLVCSAFSFCWYYVSYPSCSPTNERQKPSEPEDLPDVLADAAGKGGKNQLGERSAATAVLADGTASGTRLALSLDHAAALLERLVVTAPTSCLAATSSLA